MDTTTRIDNQPNLPAATMTVELEPGTPAEFLNHPWVKARSLARALSDALAELAAEQDYWRAHVEPANRKHPVMFEALDWKEPLEAQEYELKKFLKASDALHKPDGGWTITRDVGTGAVLRIERERMPGWDAILKLYREWAEIREASTNERSVAELEALRQRYVELQALITTAIPSTAADVAIQLVVETDQGESEWRPEFYERIEAIAKQAVAS